MPQISKRGETVYASPIRKLAVFANQAEDRGRHVYYLNIGQPDIKTPEAALQKVRNFDLKVVKYAPAEGILSYRKRLIDYYREFEIELQANQIVVTTGASEAILFMMMSCLDAGDEVIIPEPFYAIYNGFAQMANISIRPITSQIETGFSLPQVADFERVLTSKTKAIFLCNPNNPTGCLYSKEELMALATFVKKHGLFLFCDEVYREFCYDGQAFFSVLNLPEMEDNVVVVDSISKRFSACGARVGAMVSRNPRVLESVVKYARFRLSPPLLGQWLAAGTIDEKPDYMETVKAEYDIRRKVLHERLKAMPGVTCYLPGGAFYCFVRLPVADTEDFCQWLLEDFEYKGQTLMLAPGAGFYATPGLGKDEVRIAYVLNSADLNKAMDCLERALKVYSSLEMKGKKNSESPRPKYELHRSIS